MATLANQLDKAKKQTRNYSIGYSIMGLLLVGVGVYSLFVPGVSILTYGILFSSILLAQGILELTLAIGGNLPSSYSGWAIVSSIMSILLGGYLMFFPGESALVLSYTLIFVFMYKSFEAIGRSFQVKSLNTPNAIIMFIVGLLGLFLAFYLFQFPLLSTGVSMLWISTGVIFWGIYLMVDSGHIAKLKYIEEKVND